MHSSDGGPMVGLDPGDSFGFALGSPGDLDGDGRPQLAVGAPGDDDGGIDRGAVHILSLDIASTFAVNSTGDARWKPRYDRRDTRFLSMSSCA